MRATLADMQAYLSTTSSFGSQVDILKQFDYNIELRLTKYSYIQKIFIVSSFPF